MRRSTNERGGRALGFDETRIAVGPNASIEWSELSFTFQRSTGPGGQNVNKVNTRVTLYFDVKQSPSLSAAQKTRLQERLATRINRDGIMRVVSSRHRTQTANRRAAIARFIELVTEALHQNRLRRKTRTPAATKRRRIEDKKKRSRTKQLRQSPRNDND